jgi:hypothetical protein
MPAIYESGSRLSPPPIPRHINGTVSAHFLATGTPAERGRWPVQYEERQMNNHENGNLGIAIGAFAVLAALFFIATGGSFGGKTTVESDKDLPPVTSMTAPGETGR